jgi:hypothetical protein
MFENKDLAWYFYFDLFAENAPGDSPGRSIFRPDFKSSKPRLINRHIGLCILVIYFVFVTVYLLIARA